MAALGRGCGLSALDMPGPGFRGGLGEKDEVLVFSALWAHCDRVPGSDRASAGVLADL